MSQTVTKLRAKDAGQEAAWKWFWRRLLIDKKAKPKKERAK
jgi:hypothetical protein